MNLPDYESLMAQCLASLPEELDKREGSLIYMALAPCCLRLSEAYAALAGYYDLVFSDTAAGDYLDRLAGQYGITRKSASAALRKGEFRKTDGSAMTLSPGSRFYGGGLFFRVEEELGGGICSLRCETPGSAGNRSFGELLPSEYLADFGSASLSDVLIPGEDQEDDSSLRQRLSDRLSAPAFGGNVADYREKTLAIPGVGAVRVTPAQDGGGTVGLTLLDSRFLPPEEALLAVVRQEICGEGGGLGLAPIGHRVNIEAAGAVSLPVSATLICREDADGEQVLSGVRAAIEGYFDSLRRDWEEQPAVVRISALQSRMLQAPGVVDLRDVKVNGGSVNLQLDSSAVPIFDSDGSALQLASV